MAKGGLTEGPSHDEGGIDMVVKSTGQEIEVEGGELIVNKYNSADPTKFDFEGKKMTTCEIISKLNSRNGKGVTMDCGSIEGRKYEYGKGGTISGKELRKIAIDYGSREGTDMEEWGNDEINPDDVYLLKEMDVQELIDNDIDVRTFVQEVDMFPDRYPEILKHDSPNTHNKPIILNKSGMVKDGYGRLANAKAKGIDKIWSYVPKMEQGGGIDWNEMNNNEYRNCFLSIFNDLNNSEFAIEDFKVDSDRNLVAYFRDEDFSDLEKAKLDRFLGRYIDERVKPEFCKVINSFSVENNRIYLFTDNEIYQKGGEVSDLNYNDWKKKQKEDLFAKHGIRLSDSDIVYPENSLGIERSKMPQVEPEHFDQLLDELYEDNISHEYVYVDAVDLKPTQKEINLSKVHPLTPEYVNQRYLVISNDGHLIDGHHRWYWLKDRNEKAKALKIDLGVKELIDYLKNFEHCHYLDIDCPTPKFKYGGEVDNGFDLMFKVKARLVPSQQRDFLQTLGIPEQKEYLENVIEAYKEIPSYYAQQKLGYNAIVYLHYFNSGSDWYITGYDKENQEAFGYVVMNGNWLEFESGSIPMDFFKSNNLNILQKPELDFYWSYQTINEILSENAPFRVQEPVMTYEEVIAEQKPKSTTKELNLGTDWQKLIEEDNFKNPFEKVQAIEKMIDEKGQDPNKYSVIEKKFISGYTGIGGMEKYGATSRYEGDKGLLYEYFTPDNLCEFMWGLAYKHIGTKSIHNVLEPSVGAGAFISTAPVNVNITGYDISEYQIKICKVLFPEDRFEFKHESFETEFIKRNFTVGSKVSPKYDLVIGNPPFGEYKTIYSPMGEKKHTKANNFIEYFITRGLDLLHSGGLLVYVIGHLPVFGGKSFLGSDMSKVKAEIMKKADLVDAYRLGNGMFDFTKVDADVIVLRKK